MVGENTYLKEMEQQLKIVSAKVARERVEAPLSEVEEKLEEVNQKFNALRDEDAETFEAQKVEFEEAFNELSQLVTDNSDLGRDSEKMTS
jgi:FKBP-type peptidyl-prolyl cis-trans isomerase